MGLRMFRDFLRLQRWEHQLLKRDDKSEGFIVYGLRRIPWTGVVVMLFALLFFGVDLTAGIKHTASSIRESKLDAQQQLQLRRLKEKEWARKQVEFFREGEGPTEKDAQHVFGVTGMAESGAN